MAILTVMPALGSTPHKIPTLHMDPQSITKTIRQKLSASCPEKTGNEGRRDRKCPQDVVSILYAQQMKGQYGGGGLKRVRGSVSSATMMKSVIHRALEGSSQRKCRMLMHQTTLSELLKHRTQRQCERSPRFTSSECKGSSTSGRCVNKTQAKQTPTKFRHHQISYIYIYIYGEITIVNNS